MHLVTPPSVIIYLYSFILMHMVLLFIFSCFMFPPFLNFLIPEKRRGEGKYPVMPRIVIGETPVVHNSGMEGGFADGTHSPASEELRDTKHVQEQ